MLDGSLPRCYTKKHLVTGKTNELLRHFIVAKHIDVTGYRRIYKLLKISVSAVGSIIRQWKEHNFTINRS